MKNSGIWNEQKNAFAKVGHCGVWHKTTIRIPMLLAQSTQLNLMVLSIIVFPYIVLFSLLVLKVADMTLRDFLCIAQENNY